MTAFDKMAAESKKFRVAVGNTPHCLYITSRTLYFYSIPIEIRTARNISSALCTKMIIESRSNRNFYITTPLLTT